MFTPSRLLFEMERSRDSESPLMRTPKSQSTDKGSLTACLSLRNILTYLSILLNTFENAHLIDWVVVKFVNKSCPSAALEADVMKTLSGHAHIVKVVSVFHNDTYLGIVMERHGNISLSYYEFMLKAPRLDEPTARYLFSQMVSAVKFCHTKNIAHLDIKPDNIIVNEELSIKLIDFGLSSPDASNIQKGRLGTPGYMPPEMSFDGRLFLPSAADIWALGVTFYASYFLKLPFGVDVNGDFLLSGSSPLLDLHGVISEGPTLCLLTDFVQMLYSMFKFDWQERITCEELERHAWFQGLRIAGEEFYESALKLSVTIAVETSIFF
ncbi:maternal embryonic leucine zipper kinase-like [Hydractinia symbiolongicarpus]|uniref:maternal embryonic leucine zipper kinase-like n=1 Tax=Hydractinia symbiolongicarpus TaxID=13093 RepID=UPI00254D9F80|nr:maternal embryonic leucine zipper kinase-like [Hydractinia symbiolongicarpus]